MLKYLEMMCTEKLNILSAEGGVSKYLSPHVIMIKCGLDFEKHFHVPFGDFLQANKENDPTNNTAPQTIDAIYLRPMRNKQGGHELMNLATGQVSAQNRVWEHPVTYLAIKAVEKMDI